MGKIDDYIKIHNLKPSDCDYHTNRVGLNSQKKPAGNIRVLVPKAGQAMCEYTCPECRHADYTETAWKRPFYVRCSKCSFKMSVPKLKEQAKRELKAENAADDE